MTRRLLLGMASMLASAATPARLGLTDTGGKVVEFPVAAGQVTVVVFISTLCPISNAYHDRYRALVSSNKDKAVRFLFVNSNDNETLAEVREHVREAELPFPVFKDWKNVVADQLGASMTPEAFVLDGHGVTRYHGAIDDAKYEARVKVAGLKDALAAVLAGKAVARSEMKAFGCTIHRYRKIS